MEQLLLERKRKLSMANVKRKYESQAKKDRRAGTDIDDSDYPCSIWNNGLSVLPCALSVIYQ